MVYRSLHPAPTNIICGPSLLLLVTVHHFVTGLVEMMSMSRRIVSRDPFRGTSTAVNNAQLDNPRAVISRPEHMQHQQRTVSSFDSTQLWERHDASLSRVASWIVPNGFGNLATGLFTLCNCCPLAPESYSVVPCVERHDVGSNLPPTSFLALCFAVDIPTLPPTLSLLVYSFKATQRSARSGVVLDATEHFVTTTGRCEQRSGVSSTACTSFL